MNIKYLLLLSTTILFFQCSFTEDASQVQNNSEYDVDKPNFKDGKCYAKILMPDQYETQHEYYPIYTGDINNEAIDVETIKIVTQPATSKWEKKKTDRNCDSKDPNDCLVWCLVEVPEKAEEITILKDTTQSNAYEVRQFSKNILLKKGGFTVWREVLCEGQVDKLLVFQIQEKLREKGYYQAPNTNKKTIDSETKTALTQFQKSNNLPVGQLDLETMDHLGISTRF